MFITGSKVDDFHTLDKNYIYTLNVSATQELYKLIQQQNIIIQDLQKRIEILEKNNKYINILYNASKEKSS